MPARDASRRALPASTHHTGFPIVSGVLKDDAITLLRRFYDSANPRVEDTKKKKRRKPQHHTEDGGDGPQQNATTA